MTLAEIRDWLKTAAGAEHYYVGKLDRKQDKSLGVYDRAATGTPAEIALGGLDCTKTRVKRVSLLLHWNDNASETETAAQTLFDALLAAEPFALDTAQVRCLRLMTPGPVDVGIDENGIYERVIWVDFYYERIE
ncbi:MAG: minor capsid protein [Clostridiales bacterium]|nr:minor capsid protein [Clostridiales bacterium]